MTLIVRLISAGLLLSLPLLQPLWAGQPLETKRVLVLYSEDKAHPAHELTDQGIRSAFRLNTQFDVQLYNDYLDLSRFTGPTNAQVFADHLRRKYSGVKIDTIITVYPAAVDFLLREAIEFFPDTPIVANQIFRANAENLKHSPPRRYITGTIALIAIETFLILGLVMNLRRRRRAEQALNESEARLSLAAASANAGMWSITVDTGQVWATDKIRELFGFPPMWNCITRMSSG